MLFLYHVKNRNRAVVLLNESWRYTDKICAKMLTSAVGFTVGATANPVELTAYGLANTILQLPLVYRALMHGAWDVEVTPPAVQRAEPTFPVYLVIRENWYGFDNLNWVAIEAPTSVTHKGEIWGAQVYVSSINGIRNYHVEYLARMYTQLLDYLPKGVFFR